MEAATKAAKSLGVKPMHVDDPGFGKVANEEDNSLKWAVTESGDKKRA
jgi:hypothetical protein